MQFLIKQYKFINMRINIQNRLVQQDLFELLNSDSTDINIQEEDGKIYLIKTEKDEDFWLGEIRYIYDDMDVAKKDLKTLKSIMKILNERIISVVDNHGE